MTSAIKGLLFDKDGTLIDVIATWLPVYREMLAEAFPGREAHWDSVMRSSGFEPTSNSFKANSMLAVGTTDQLVDLWWPGLDHDERRRRIVRVDDEFKSRSTKYIQSLVPLKDFFGELQARGLKVGIATNDSERSARNHVDLLGVEDLVDFVAGYNSVSRAKPAGDMVHAFCKACGLRPSEVAVIGDNLHDMEMGRDAGAGLVIGVLSGNSSREDFGTIADVVLESVADLPTFLDGR